MFSSVFTPPHRWSKKSLSLLLVAVGLLVVILYSTCLETCAGVAGTLAGIDLTYVGAGFLMVIGAGLLAGWQGPVYGLLSSGVGAEIYLVAYQVRTGEYCPFCLIFGASILALFSLQFHRSHLKMVLLGLPLGFLLLLLAFVAAPLPSYGADVYKLPQFGTGPVEVRLYTDYFCAPCSSMEAEVEKKLIDLVEQGRAQVVFVDVPLHAPTPVYARYFLSLLQSDTTFREALEYRRLFFKAAGLGLETEEKLDSWLKLRGIAVSKIEGPGIFALYDSLLAEDRIRSTPSLVVVQEGGRRQVVSGTGAVLKEIEALVHNPS